MRIQRARLSYFLRFLLGSLFVVAGCLKAADPQAFAASVAGFGIVPRGFSNVVAMMLPPFEILCGALLIRGPLWRPAALGILGMNMVFIAVLAHAWANGHAMECGCFGKWDPLAKGPAWAIVRDGVFMAMAGVLWREGAMQCDRPVESVEKAAQPGDVGRCAGLRGQL